MAIAHVASNISSSATTSGIDSTSATLAVAHGRGYPFTSGSTITISGGVDSKGNSYTALTARNSGADNTVLRPFYCVNPTVGSGHTITVVGDVNVGAGLQTFSGTHASSPYEAEVGATTTGATSLASGSITPSIDDCVVITQNCCFNAGSLTVPSGFTGSTHIHGSPNALTGGHAYKIQTTAGAENPSWSWGSTKAASSLSLVFKPAAGGGGGGTVIPVFMNQYRQRWG